MWSLMDYEIYSHHQWAARNSARHGGTPEQQAACRLDRVKRQIVDLYTMKDKCLPFDRGRLFYTSAEEHFEKSKRYGDLSAWYAVNAAVIYKSCETLASNESRGQRLISDFFALSGRGGRRATD